MVHQRKKWQSTAAFFLGGHRGQYEKAKRYDTGRWPCPPPGWKVSNMLLGKIGGQLLIAPERMKQLGQSMNDVGCGCVWW